MALNIKSRAVEDLVVQVAELAGETKTEAIRKALEERRQRLVFHVKPVDKAVRLKRFLEREVWPNVPKSKRGKRLTRRQEEAILGYGPEGV